MSFPTEVLGMKRVIFWWIFINHICKLENITIDDYDKDFIIKNSDKNILFLLNFIDYLKLLNIKRRIYTKEFEYLIFWNQLETNYFCWNEYTIHNVKKAKMSK